jgi:hypothetical protein
MIVIGCRSFLIVPITVATSVSAERILPAHFCTLQYSNYSPEPAQ